MQSTGHPQNFQPSLFDSPLNLDPIEGLPMTMSPPPNSAPASAPESTTNSEADAMLSCVSDNELDHTPLTFGKYSGKTPNDVASIDPHWLVWAFNNVTNRVTCSRLLANECEKQPRKFTQR